MSVNKFKMVAKTFAGLEPVLADELTTLGAESVTIERRAVSFYGDQETLYKANFLLRTALRVLKPVAEFEVTKKEQLFNYAKKVKWTDYLALGKTFAIDSTVQSETFVNTMYASLKVKDAIADHFREATGKRPSVNTADPDVRINVHLMGNHCILSLDSSGESLHKRGYRLGQGEAPLNEVLAAGMILLSGWHGERNFLDPMCGSGTLLIEAAMIAKGIPPGIYRKSFGFERWPDFNQNLFEEIYNREYENEFNCKVVGSDISVMNISIAKANIKNAGLSKVIEVSVKDIRELDPPFENGIIITNPPYGERIKPQSIENLYTEIGNVFKRKLAGYEAWVLSGSVEGFKSIGLKPSRKIELYNGSISCSFRCYNLFQGPRKKLLVKKNSTK